MFFGWDYNSSVDFMIAMVFYINMLGVQYPVAYTMHNIY